MADSLNLSVRQAAALLGISHNHLYTYLLHRPDFPAYRIGNRWVIPWCRGDVRKKAEKSEENDETEEADKK